MLLFDDGFAIVRVCSICLQGEEVCIVHEMTAWFTRSNTKLLCGGILVADKDSVQFDRFFKESTGDIIV